MSLEENYHSVKHQLGQVQLLVVSKLRSIQDIETLYRLGQRHFGENRVQELIDKDHQLKHLKELQWHMIGHLQTNKLKKILNLERLHAIHSIDRSALFQELLKVDSQIQRTKPIALFWEFNLSKDGTKQGFTELEQALPLMMQSSNLNNFFNQGLMCMGPSQDDELFSKTRKTFSLLKKFKDFLEQHAAAAFPESIELSMGMSNDYPVAIQEGSQWVRIGSKLFL